MGFVAPTKDGPKVLALSLGSGDNNVLCVQGRRPLPGAIPRRNPAQLPSCSLTKIEVPRKRPAGPRSIRPRGKTRANSLFRNTFHINNLNSILWKEFLAKVLILIDRWGRGGRGVGTYSCNSAGRPLLIAARTFAIRHSRLPKSAGSIGS